MNNSYHILSKNCLDIERFHICTWDIGKKDSYLEFGLEFKTESLHDLEELFVCFESLCKSDNVCSLLKNLYDSSNSRFIFNDIVSSTKLIGQDKSDGYIIYFAERDPLTVLPCDLDVQDGKIKISFSKTNEIVGNVYIRVLITLHEKTVALINKGISRETYTYDIKVNENRNLPHDIQDFKRNEGLVFCHVNKLFCLHAIPDSFDFGFIDNTKLKNVRRLETGSFVSYLPEIKEIKKDCYNIVFLKEEGKTSYSLFTVISKETIGIVQVAFAICANLFCSLLFALSSLRMSNRATGFSIPWEYWVSFFIIVLLVIYVVYSVRKK